MNRIKSIALTVLGVAIALAGLGFFASIGLAIIGALFVVGACGLLAAGFASLFGKSGVENRGAA